MTRAFTIIEMLVVIGILAVLMGLTLGAIAGTKRSDKLLATEQLVAGFIRQARHTARTSGAPVVVVVDKTERRVQGISQVPVWVEDFDGSGGLSGTLGTAGATGQGYRIALPDDGPPSHQLANSERLGRSATRTDGFYLSCQVFPPQIAGAGVAGVAPVIVIGPDTERSTSLAGLALQVRREPVQEIPTADAQPGGSGQLPQLRTWEIFGWLGDGTDTPPEVSSIESADIPLDVTRDEPLLHPSVASQPRPNDIAGPLGGGRWIEVGLLFDGERLVLYRDGVRVGERRFSTPPAIQRGDETITIGALRIADASGNPIIYIADNVRFDNIRITRLTSGDPSPLPGDVVPDETYRIVAHPDGRVEVNQVEKLTASTTAAANAQDGILTFSGTFNTSAKATVTVSVDGRVSSALVPKP